MDNKLPSSSAALSSVFYKGNFPDEDLYRNIPEVDKEILSSYLEGEDENGKPYFSRSEKTNFLKKWKTKNRIRESVGLSSSFFKGDPSSELKPITKDFVDNNLEVMQGMTIYDNKGDSWEVLKTNVNPSSTGVYTSYGQLAGYFDFILRNVLSNKKKKIPANDILDYFWKPPTAIGTQKVKELINRDKEEEQEILIDLNQTSINESFLRTFGWMIEKVLQRMFGMSSIPVKLRGSKEQISAFTDAITSEKKYLDALQQYGLDSPHTYRNKSVLDRAIDQFTRKTGIKWPFKK